MGPPGNCLEIRFMTTTESQVEHDLIATLGDLKYTHRPDIRDRAALEANFRARFAAPTSVTMECIFQEEAIA
jgi:hypothetical protein